MNWKEFLKPKWRNIVMFIIVFIVIEIILWFMTVNCAVGCPKPPSPCVSHCLLDPQNLLIASMANILVSFIIVWIYDKVKKKK